MSVRSNLTIILLGIVPTLAFVSACALCAPSERMVFAFVNVFLIVKMASTWLICRISSAEC